MHASQGTQVCIGNGVVMRKYVMGIRYNTYIYKHLSYYYYILGDTPTNITLIPYCFSVVTIHKLLLSNSSCVFASDIQIAVGLGKITCYDYIQLIYTSCGYTVQNWNSDFSQLSD